MTLWVPVQIIVPGTIDPIAVQWGSPGGAKFGDAFQPVLSASLVDHSIQCEGSFSSRTKRTLTLDRMIHKGRTENGLERVTELGPSRTAPLYGYRINGAGHYNLYWDPKSHLFSYPYGNC